MVENKTLAIIVLLVMVIVTSTGWIGAESRPRENVSLPSGIYSWTEYFRGYEVYLDRRIFPSEIHGTSMEPTLRENDLLLWVRVKPSELKVGDIIIFKHPTKPYIDNVAHRIVEILFQDGKYMFRTKGDSSGVDRNPVPEANIHGLVIGVIYRYRDNLTHDNLNSKI